MRLTGNVRCNGCWKLVIHSDSINDRLPAIRIVSTVAWQNVLLCCNLMSASIPSLKGFTREIMTAGVSLGYSKKGGTTSASGTQPSYKLQELEPSNMRPNISPQDESPCYYEERVSFASHDSRRNMITIQRELRVLNDAFLSAELGLSKR
jgi:hypothetical protein